MPGFLLAYVRITEAIGRRVGRATMYMIFVIMAVLLFSSITKALFDLDRNLLGLAFFPAPPHWTLETSQFLMVAYFLLGGAYSMQLDTHVRMDLVYGTLTDRTKAMVDVLTICFLIFYLSILLYGGLSSTTYALEYGERSPTAWRPYMAPIKIIMCFGILLMLLQGVANLIRDVAKLRGVTVP